MTPALLHAIGEALFGPRWQTTLASRLNVNERTVRRWAAGNNEIPRGVVEQLEIMLSDQSDHLRYLATTLANA